MPTLDWLAQVLHGRRPARAAGPGCRAAGGAMGPGPAAGRGLFPDGGGRGNDAERAGKNDVWAGPAGTVDYAGPCPVLQLPERARHGFGRAGGGLGLFGGEPPGPVASVGARRAVPAGRGLESRVPRRAFPLRCAGRLGGPYCSLPIGASCGPGAGRWPESGGSGLTPEDGTGQYKPDYQGRHLGAGNMTRIIYFGKYSHGSRCGPCGILRHYAA